MMIIGCDYHPGFEQIAFVDTETGAVAGGGTHATRVVPVCTVGEPATRRSADVAGLTPTMAELTQAVEQEAEKCPEARRLQTHPGVGALTALAFVLIIGPAKRA